ncbi:MAG: amidohydrolase family protein [Bryobacteraceae bacterium]|nr:amidohydrolase family protein [Bryobacteraceae bacterium]
MRNRVRLIPLGAAAVLFSIAPVLAQSPPVIAIRNARIVPVSGPAIEKGTVVMRNGLIADVGTEAAVPADAWVLDGTGLTVYPGLVEAMGSVGIPETMPAPGMGARGAMPGTMPSAMPGALPAAPPARGPEDRPLTNSWTRAADLVRPNERRIEALRNQGYTSAAAFPSAGIFTGQGAVINLSGESGGRMVVENGIGQFITMSRGGFTAFPGSLMGTIAYVRQVFLDANHYRTAKETYARAPQGLERPAYDRALEGILESKRFLIPAVNAVEIDRMLRFAAELKVSPVLYGLHEGYKAVDKISKAGVPVLISTKWPEPPRDRDPDEVDSMRDLELRENAPSTPAALAKAGVKFAFYSDGAESPSRNVRRAIQKGLSPEQALRAMTIAPAEIFGVADRLGSIEKGKIANLVVTKGDLFADRPQVQYVFVDGVRYEAPPPAMPAKPEMTQ